MTDQLQVLTAPAGICPCCGAKARGPDPEPILEFVVDGDGVARWQPGRALSMGELIEIITKQELPID